MMSVYIPADQDHWPRFLWVAHSLASVLKTRISNTPPPRGHARDSLFITAGPSRPTGIAEVCSAGRDPFQINGLHESTQMARAFRGEYLKKSLPFSTLTLGSPCCSSPARCLDSGQARKKEGR